MFSGVALAEESGVMLGIGAGYTGGTIKADYAMPQGQVNEKLTSGSADIAVVAGYKYFFTPSLGIRGYGNFNYQPEYSNKDGKLNLNSMDYGVNVDFLYNFLTDTNYDFGLFAGLGLGGNTYGGDAVKVMEENAGGVAKINKTFFDMGLNIGLRTNFYKYFGVEVGARVPFMTNKIVDHEFVKLSVKRDYSVGAKLIFSF